MSRRTIPGPSADDRIPAFVAALGVPGLADVHVHFLPPAMQHRVWAYFDQAEARYGMPWPITYRTDEATRVATLRTFGLTAIPALSYAHKPGMAAWLNAWARDFAIRVPDAVQCATFYPEPCAAEDVGAALANGARLFKLHVEVGDFALDDPLLDEAWGLLAEAGAPVVVHCGSAPLRGRHTGPDGLRRLLAQHPDVTIIVAHLGMPEYRAFADLAEAHEHVFLDTTMAATDFSNRFAPMPEGYRERLGDLQHKVVLGSDFPSIPYPYAHQLEALARLDHGDDWLRSVLWFNGARLLGLS